MRIAGKLQAGNATEQNVPNGCIALAEVHACDDCHFADFATAHASCNQRANTHALSHALASRFYASAERHSYTVTR